MSLFAYHKYHLWYFWKFKSLFDFGTNTCTKNIFNPLFNKDNVKESVCENEKNFLYKKKTF